MDGSDLKMHVISCKLFLKEYLKFFPAISVPQFQMITALQYVRYA